MYAVITSGGKQYRIEPGTKLSVELLPGDAGGSVTFDRVLLIGDGDEVTVGTPTVPGASVSATVLGEELGPKLVIYKFKQKVKYRRRTGHRQHLTSVRIDAINTAAPKRATARRATAKASEQAEAQVETAANPKGRRAPRAKKAEAPATTEKVEEKT
ncbi:MAG: 50S ribosomal protein L21 [Chloroflexota bacterium]|nr:50S ribosomal protein L21 [Chloroflexota bacterium]